MHDPSTPKRKPVFQYNLSALLLLMVATCLSTWVLFVLPGPVSVMVLICVLPVVPSVVLAGIVYFRGYPQAFFIGCVPPLTVVFWSSFSWGYMIFRGFGPIRSGNDWEFKIALVVGLAVVAVSGMAAMGVRYLAVLPEAEPRLPRRLNRRFPGLPTQEAIPLDSTPEQPISSESPSSS